jgi:hypothetical protein
MIQKVLLVNGNLCTINYGTKVGAWEPEPFS